MKPLAHQEKFVQGYDGKRLIVWEGGTGKTIAGCLWLRDGRDADALVICPKKVVKKWQKALSDWGTKATVLSKENFKKQEYKSWSGVVVDEADEFASPLFTKGRSKLTECLYNLVRLFRPQVLLLTATPIRSNPWNLHTLLTFVGKYVDWKEWRERFFKLERRPYLPRPAWLPRANWRKLMRPLLEEHGDIVLLKDCVKDVPAVYEERVATPYKEKFVPEDWEGSKAFHAEHKHEQKEKLEHILEIGKEYRKVLVVVYYQEQIGELEKSLKKHRETFSIHGKVSTEKQEDIIAQAQESDECFFIVQAGMGAGFDGDSFSCVVFASMSYAVRDFVQMKFRVRRIHNLHPVAFYYLIGGRCDESVLDNVQKGFDFVPSEWKISPSSQKSISDVKPK